MLDEFAGPSTGPILEEAATPPAAEAPLTFATSEAPPEAPAQPETAVEPPPPSGDQPDEFDLTIEEPARDDAPNLEDLEGIEPPPPAAPAPPPATPAPAPPPARKSAFDPFLGMGRDEGSFIGGMPLQFGPLIPLPRPAPQAPAAAAAPTPPPPSEPKEQAKPAVPEELPPDVPSLADLEGLEPGPHPAGGVSATTGGDAVPPDLELDLSLPDLPDLEAPAAGKAAGTAGRSAEAFDPSALDLPELPPLDLPPLDVTEGGPSPVEAELPPLELPAPPPVSMTTASPVDQPVDPLSFTENEAETLQLLPRPQPPRAGAAGGGPPAAAPPGRESPERESPGGGPPRTTSAPAQPPRAERQRPPASPPRPSRAQAYPATTPPPARGGMPRRQPRGAFDLDLDLGAEFDIPPAAPRPGKGGAGAPARPVPTGGFNGLAMPPVREADVFSPLAFGGGDAIPSTAPPPAGKAGAGQAATT